MGFELFNELMDTTRDLDNTVGEMESVGLELAEAERDYKTALATEILTLRAKGLPVTVIQDVARGSKKVADLRFKRDCKEVLYKSTFEAINATKLKVRVLNDQVAREYGRPGMD